MQSSTFHKFNRLEPMPAREHARAPTRECMTSTSCFASAAAAASACNNALCDREQPGQYGNAEAQVVYVKLRCI